MLSTGSMIEAPTPRPFDPATAGADPPGMGRAPTIWVAIGAAVSLFSVGGVFLAVASSLP